MFAYLYVFLTIFNLYLFVLCMGVLPEYMSVQCSQRPEKGLDPMRLKFETVWASM